MIQGICVEIEICKGRSGSTIYDIDGIGVVGSNDDISISVLIDIASSAYGIAKVTRSGSLDGKTAFFGF